MEKKQSVLVIDDSPTVRRLAELGLSEEGYTVYTAEDGDVGLEIAKREMPSIILVDFIMPHMNGFQLCKNIRADSALGKVPIILITSKGEDVGQGFEEHFSIDHYLQKPFETETLIKAVNNVLSLKAAHDRPSNGEAREEIPESTVSESPLPETNTLPDVVPLESPEAIVPDSGEEIPAYTLPEDMSFIEISGVTAEYSSGEFNEMPACVSSEAHDEDQEVCYDSPADSAPETVFSNTDFAAMEDKMKEPFVMDLVFPTDQANQEIPSGTDMPEEGAPLPGFADDSEAVPATPARQPDSSGRSVLVIDDSPTVRKLAELGLKEEGYTVYTAEDGDVGLEIAKRELPSIILVDFIMPNMNGFQLCKSIRADASLSHIPIVLITSKGKDVGQGFDEKFSIAQYLQKPFDTERLARTVKEVLGDKTEQAVPSSQEIHNESPVSADPETPVPDTVTLSSQEETPQLSEPCISSQDAEVPHAEDEPVECGVQQASPQEQHQDIRYADLLEEMKKELRLYFGQELPSMVKTAVFQSMKEADLVRSSRPALSGDVASISASQVLRLISTSGLSGKLSVFGGSLTSETYFEKGKIVFASVSGQGLAICLEKILEENGKAAHKEIGRVMNESRGNSLAAGRALLERSLVDSDELAEYYRNLIQRAVRQTVAAASGYFYFETVPLPAEVGNTGIRISPEDLLDTTS